MSETRLLNKNNQLHESGEPLLDLQGLSIAFKTDGGEFTAVDKVSFSLRPGRTLGIVGESGCGKSVTALSLLRLVPHPGRITAGVIRFMGQDLMALSANEMRRIRGGDIAMIFQEPVTALNPVFTIGDQIAEAYRLHHNASAKEAHETAIVALDRVGIPGARHRAKSYPHQLSGGMRQRAVIAMALISRPRLLIADEATTALDTTIQAQIIDLLLDLQDEYGMAILFISHNLGIVSEIADEVMVMYAGQVVEKAPTEIFFGAPRHPYSAGLLTTLPQPERRNQILPTIEGSVTVRYDQLTGCRFAPRCVKADDFCRRTDPELEAVAAGHGVACLKMEFAP